MSLFEQLPTQTVERVLSYLHIGEIVQSIRLLSVGHAHFVSSAEQLWTRILHRDFYRTSDHAHARCMDVRQFAPLSLVDPNYAIRDVESGPAQPSRLVQQQKQQKQGGRQGAVLVGLKQTRDDSMLWSRPCSAMMQCLMFGPEDYPSSYGRGSAGRSGCMLHELRFQNRSTAGRPDAPEQQRTDLHTADSENLERISRSSHVSSGSRRRQPQQGPLRIRHYLLSGRLDTFPLYHIDAVVSVNQLGEFSLHHWSGGSHTLASRLQGGYSEYACLFEEKSANSALGPDSVAICLLVACPVAQSKKQFTLGRWLYNASSDLVTYVNKSSFTVDLAELTDMVIVGHLQCALIWSLGTLLVYALDSLEQTSRIVLPCSASRTKRQTERLSFPRIVLWRDRALIFYASTLFDIPLYVASLEMKDVRQVFFFPIGVSRVLNVCAQATTCIIEYTNDSSSFLTAVDLVSTRVLWSRTQMFPVLSTVANMNASTCIVLNRLFVAKSVSQGIDILDLHTGDILTTISLSMSVGDLESSDGEPRRKKPKKKRATKQDEERVIVAAERVLSQPMFSNDFLFVLSGRERETDGEVQEIALHVIHIDFVATQFKQMNIVSFSDDRELGSGVCISFPRLATTPCGGERHDGYIKDSRPSEVSFTLMNLPSAWPLEPKN
eukprot:ANDGO_00136.mRNA.1 hypothetical protein